ncbi:MAG: hypothetical protein AAFU38_02940 [Bacteroidota bacterium]
MPLLDWDPTDVIECLEVLPEAEEPGIDYGFSCTSDGTHLRLDVWPLESLVALSIYREGVEQAIVTFWFYVLDRIRQVKHTSGNCLLFERVVLLTGPNPLDEDELKHVKAELSLRLQARPHVQVAFV